MPLQSIQSLKKLHMIHTVNVTVCTKTINILPTNQLVVEKEIKHKVKTNVRKHALYVAAECVKNMPWA